MKSPLFKQTLVLALITTSLTACNTAERLASVGRAPSLSAIDDPTASLIINPFECLCPNRFQ